MFREEFQHLKTGPRELRRFGLTVGAVFLALGIWFWWRGKARFPYFVAPGALLVVLGAAAPRVLRWIYLGWMALAFCLGFVVSNVLLTFFFYLVVTPIGLVSRLAGKDFLNRKWNAQAKSYWIKRAPRPAGQPRNDEQQY